MVHAHPQAPKQGREFTHPSSGVDLELIVDAGLDPLEDPPVGMLNLAIRLGVIDRSPIHLDYPGVTEVQELVTCELSAIVSNNVTGDSEHVDDVLNEFGRLLRLEVGDGLDFDPLGELVNGDQEVIEAPRHLLELPDHVEAPD